MFFYWAVDQYYNVKTIVHSLFNPRPKKWYTDKSLTKNPVIVIAGLSARWNSFRHIIKLLVQSGHPVYIAEKLKRNFIAVKQGAELIREVIEKNNLQDVVLIGHSKGGLIGKYLLAFFNNDHRIKKLIAVAAPFAGTSLPILQKVEFLTGECLPGNPLLKQLDDQAEVNQNITCIYGTYENMVLPLESCRLDGAKNIQLNIKGHVRLLFQTETESTILTEVENA